MNPGTAVRVSFLLAIAFALPAPARVLTTSDLFRMESFGAVVPSPDERLLAIVRVRPRSTAAMQMRDFMDGRDRSDVWLYDLANASRENITNGAADGSGFFAPAWSPDGERLALLSTRGNSITLWEWRRSTRKLRQVSTTIVELSTPVWISNSDLVCATPPDGEQPWIFALEVRAPIKAMENWPKSWSGTTVTASALTSGPGLRSDSLPQGRLLRMDVVTGETTTLSRGIYTSISASPDGRLLAAFELAARFRPEPGTLIPNRNYSRYRLVLFHGAAKQTLVELTGRQEPLPGPVAWLSDGRLAARIAITGGRTDWLLAGAQGGEPVNLTATLQTVPPALIPSHNGRELLAVSEGKIWRLSPAPARPERVFDDADTLIHSVVSRQDRAWLIRAQRNGHSGLFVLTPAHGSLHLLREPSSGAEVKAFLPNGAAAVFSQVARSGTQLSIVATDHPPRPLITLNSFVGEITEGVWKQFTYSGSPARTPSTAWVLLPPGFREGTRYPTVVSVYPGLVYGPAQPPRDAIQSAGPYNMQLLAARGYAVLFPSIPLSPEGQPGEPYRQILEGVMPSVDEAVRLGISDGERLALMGHSFGGYATYALITQTDRFQAAIAMGGFCNLVSLYGQLDPRARYEDDARDRLIFMMFAESGQFRMGAPPWTDMDRYIRNSPISYAGRVQTPLMIVQGDQDYVPIQQGEEFFTALFRQQKPAVFVRYWGEGHIMESPANITDLWKRIGQWLGRYLQRPSK